MESLQQNPGLQEEPQNNFNEVEILRKRMEDQSHIIDRLKMELNQYKNSHQQLVIENDDLKQMNKMLEFELQKAKEPIVGDYP